MEEALLSGFERGLDGDRGVIGPAVGGGHGVEHRMGVDIEASQDTRLSLLLRQARSGIKNGRRINSAVRFAV